MLTRKRALPAHSEILDDLVDANRILAMEGVLDGYGHVSVRAGRPFGITRGKLRPVYHMASFLWSGVPVFDMRSLRNESDLLVRDREMGGALAAALGRCPCVLMRGHGMTVVGDSLPEAVFRAIYTASNAKLQMQAAQLEGPIEFPSDAEGRLATASNRPTIEQPWQLWKEKARATKRRSRA